MPLYYAQRCPCSVDGFLPWDGFVIRYIRSLLYPASMWMKDAFERRHMGPTDLLSVKQVAFLFDLLESFGDYIGRVHF